MSQQSGTSQIDIENRGASILGRPFSESMTLGQVFGPIENWLLPLGPYHLLYMPIHDRWLYWDWVHESWQDTGHKAFEVEFYLDGDQVMTRPVSAMAAPAKDLAQQTFAQRPTPPPDSLPDETFLPSSSPSPVDSPAAQVPDVTELPVPEPPPAAVPFAQAPAEEPVFSEPGAVQEIEETLPEAAQALPEEPVQTAWQAPAAIENLEEPAAAIPTGLPEEEPAQVEQPAVEPVPAVLLEEEPIVEVQPLIESEPAFETPFVEPAAPEPPAESLPIEPVAAAPLPVEPPVAAPPDQPEPVFPQKPEAPLPPVSPLPPVAPAADIPMEPPQPPLPPVSPLPPAQPVSAAPPVEKPALEEVTPRPQRKADEFAATMLYKRPAIWELRVLEGAGTGIIYHLKPVTTVGRSSDNVIALDDPMASRHHARIESVGELYIVTDLGSSNGTFVNEEKITKPTLLDEGSYLLVGQTKFILQKKEG